MECGKMQIGGLISYKSIVKQGHSDGAVNVLDIYPNEVGIENTRIYFKVTSV
jgi:maltooligosyltrehalose synthase